MSKGGTESESTTELPPWYAKYAQDALAMSNKIAQKGYVPYQGPDIAAFAPQQVQAMQQANDWTAAFSKPGTKSVNVQNQLMPSQRFAGGINGFSSFPGYQEAMAKWKKKYPGQFNYVKGFSINPVTGQKAPQYAAPLKPVNPGGGGGPGTGPGGSLQPGDPGYQYPLPTRGGGDH